MPYRQENYYTVSREKLGHPEHRALMRGFYGPLPVPGTVLDRVLGLNMRETRELAEKIRCHPVTLMRCQYNMHFSTGLMLPIMAVLDPNPPEMLEDRLTGTRIELNW